MEVDGRESGPDARKLRRLQREAEALRIVRQISRKIVPPLEPGLPPPTPEEIEAAYVSRLDDNQEHCVYFMYCAGHVKIGYTSLSSLSRLRDLSTKTPLETFHLLTLSGGERTEYLLHKAFSDHRVRGEWFKFHQDIKDFILGHGEEYVRAVKLAERDYRRWVKNEAINLKVFSDEK